MTAPERIAEHLAWIRRNRGRRKYYAKPTTDIASAACPCIGCGCLGNRECEHEPLAVPEHQCELDIGDDGESCRCYCCRSLDGRLHHAHGVNMSEQVYHPTKDETAQCSNGFTGPIRNDRN